MGKTSKVCPVCSKTFTSRYTFARHMVVHTGDKNFTCKICNNSFQQKSNLQTHIERVHAKILPFVCTECGLKFGYSSHFKQHMKGHLVNKAQLSEEVKKMILKPHECLECHKHFDTKSKLKKHMMDHIEPKIYFCDKCGRGFKSNYTLSQHIKNIHDEDRGDGYVCEQCGIVYNNKRSIQEHHRKGHPEGSRGSPAAKNKLSDEDCIQTIVCPVCGKVVSKRYLGNHLNTHTKSRVYPCNFCGKAFLEYSNRKNHERIHTGERPYVCEVCGKGHAQLGNLLAHRKRVHQLCTPVPNLPEKQPKKKTTKRKCVKNPIASDSNETPNTLDAAKLEEEVNLNVELNKIKDMVSEEKVQNDCLDSVEKLLNVTNNWVDQQFRASKQKIDKTKIADFMASEDTNLEKSCELSKHHPLSPSLENINDKSNHSDSEETSSSEDMPLSHLLSTNLLGDSIKIEIQDDTQAGDGEDSWDNQGQMKVESLITDPTERYINSIMDNVKAFRSRMNRLIVDKLLEELNYILEPSGVKQIQEIIRKAEEKNSNPLASLLRKGKILNNKIVSITKKKDGKVARTWTCWECCGVFQNHYGLSRHLITHQPDEINPFRCNQCEKTFKQLENLREHIMFHNDEKRYYCEHCGAGFRHKSNFKYHLIKHYDMPGALAPKVRIKNHECSHCNKKFYSRAHMIEHERMHTKLAPHLCKDCGKQYRNKSTFMRHLKSHLNIRDYGCNLCFRKFGTKYLLDRHKLTHSGEKKFGCECGKTFTQKCSLQKHKSHCINNTSPPPKTHVCTLCTRAFFQKHDLERHMLTHDPAKRFQCQLCFIMLKTSISLRRHVERHIRKNEQGLDLSKPEHRSQMFIDNTGMLAINSV